MVEPDKRSPMSESDVTAMKETLRAQQQLLQKLYAELDQEREASSTAASEAMDMILRLQGEKAAVKMEASHFKRMAEEKLEHAEATLELYEEIMFQKEMEIASLEYQVLAYKHKLLAFGVDFGVGDLEFPEDLLSLNRERDEPQSGETSSGQSSGNNVRRLTSLPPIQFKSHFRAARKRDRSLSPAPIPDMIPRTADSSDQEDFGHGTLDSYWNQIKTLDEKVKVISDYKEPGEEKGLTTRMRRGRSCSVFSQASSKINSDQTDSAVPSTCSTRINSLESTVDREVVANVHDVFEVPQTSERHEVGDQGKKRLEKWISDPDNRLTKPDSVSELQVKPGLEKLKGFMFGGHELRIPSPRDKKAIVWHKKEGVDGDGNNAQAELQKLNRRIERLERDRMSTRHEIKNGGGEREEQLRLLKDICSQLQLIQTEVRSLKAEKSTPPKEHDVPLYPLQEAMMYFWL